MLHVQNSAAYIETCSKDTNVLQIQRNAADTVKQRQKNVIVCVVLSMVLILLLDMAVSLTLLDSGGRQCYHS